MGIKQSYLEYINKCIGDALGDMRGKRMLELGNQVMMGNFIPQKTGKEYFKDRGIEHISVDWNGLDGALPLDLTRPEQFIKWYNYFDIITNCGTTEHVETLKDQYKCFSVIHDCLKCGGIAIHVVPDIDELLNKGSYSGHSLNYYSHAFFKMLAVNNGYRLLSSEIIEDHLCACLQKNKDVPFMKDRKEFLKHIARRPPGTLYHDPNDRGVMSFFSSIKKAHYKPTLIMANLIIYSRPLRRRLGLYKWWQRPQNK